MAAVVNKKGKTQQPNQKKSQVKQTKQKAQGKQMKGVKSKQATKQVKKPVEKKGSSKGKECHLSRPAKRVLGSYLERLCKSVSREAERLMKENRELNISGKVLQTALERSMAKGKRHSVIPGIKKAKKNESSEEGAERVSSPSDKQDASSQKLPKQRKHSATSMSN
ncbi:uncharacterized protein [Anolis sagrei]|uniref:uncharacterized protein n=1 Tax=Anolis sagrei TaxID=38937 RepID=UPI00351FBC57